MFNSSHVSGDICHMSCVTCHVSCVTNHMSCVMCHMSHDFFFVFFFLFFLDKLVELVSGESGIHGDSQSSLILIWGPIQPLFFNKLRPHFNNKFCPILNFLIRRFVPGFLDTFVICVLKFQLMLLNLFSKVLASVRLRDVLQTKMQL